MYQVGDTLNIPVNHRDGKRIWDDESAIRASAEANR